MCVRIACFGEELEDGINDGRSGDLDHMVQYGGWLVVRAEEVFELAAYREHGPAKVIVHRDGYQVVLIGVPHGMGPKRFS